MTYGGFRIGYLKKGNLLCSQILSIGLLNVITYIQISLLDKKFHDPKILTAMTLVQLFDSDCLDNSVSAVIPVFISAQKNAAGVRRSPGVSFNGKNQFT